MQYMMRRDWMRVIAQRLAGEPGEAADLEIVEEVAQHLQDRYDELRASGASEEAAYHAVLGELEEVEPGELVRELPARSRGGVGGSGLVALGGSAGAFNGSR